MSKEQSKIMEEVRKLLDKSLINAKPLFILDTNAVTGIDGFAIQALPGVDVTFTTLNAVYEGGDPAGLTLTAGTLLYLPIKGTVDLATGKVVIYQNKNLSL